MHLGVRGSGKVTGYARENGAKEAESARNYQCNYARFSELLSGESAFQYLVQNQEAEHRQCYLKYYQCHRDCPELAVERHIIVPELRKRHEVASHAEQYRDECGGNYPPLVTPLAHEESENEQEYCYGSHIHRACCERLRTPVKRKILGNLPGIGLSVLLQELYSL